MPTIIAKRAATNEHKDKLLYLSFIWELWIMRMKQNIQYWVHPLGKEDDLQIPNLMVLDVWKGDILEVHSLIRLCWNLNGVCNNCMEERLMQDFAVRVLSVPFVIVKTSAFAMI